MNCSNKQKSIAYYKKLIQGIIADKVEAFEQQEFLNLYDNVIQKTLNNAYNNDIETTNFLSTLNTFTNKNDLEAIANIIIAQDKKPKDSTSTSLRRVQSDKAITLKKISQQLLHLNYNAHQVKHN